MRFTDSKITTQGKALLARAVQAGEIIWGKAQCATDSADESTVSFSQVVATGSVTMTRCTGQSVSITARVSNAEMAGGRANSFGIFAKIQGDAEETLVAVSIADDSAPCVFPDNRSGNEDTLLTAAITIGVTLSDSVVSEIDVDTGLYAMQSDLVELAGRVVTTHSAADPTAGDNQTIRGLKTFANGLDAASITAGSIQPQAANTGVIGSELIPWGTIHAKNLGTTNPTQGDCPIETAVITDLYATNIGKSNKCVTNAHISNLNATAATLTTATTNKILAQTVPILAPTATIGTAAQPFDEGHFKTLTGLLDTLWGDGVGGLFTVYVGGRNMTGDGQVMRGEELYDGQNIGGGNMAIMYYDSEGPITPNFGNIKFRALDCVTVPQNTSVNAGIKVLAIMVEKT